MIVTCPKCAAKYRVRDEAVPPGGAELECPECSAHFIAHPPSTEDLNRAIDRLNDGNATLEAKLEEANTHLQSARSETQVAREDVEKSKADGAEAVKMRDEEIARLRNDVATKTSELGQVAADAGRLRQMVDEGGQVRDQLLGAQQQLKAAQQQTHTVQQQAQASQTETTKLREQLTAMSSVPAELELARQRIKMLEAQGGGNADREKVLEAEMKSLKEQLAMAMATAADSGRVQIPPEIASMVAAMGPMLWGLDQAIEYLEQFSENEDALAAHVRQLNILAGIIKRLTAEVSR